MRSDVDLSEAMQERRSTRGFLHEPVERKILERLLSLATQALSVINLQPREITIVSGEEQVVIGIALGYRDPEASAHRVRSGRVPLSDVVKWRE